MDGFTIDELEQLEKEVLKLAKKYPNETKKFLQKQGNKLKSVVKKIAKAKVKTKTGNYMRGLNVENTTNTMKKMIVLEFITICLTLI